MNMAPDANPNIEGFRIEDAEDVRHKSETIDFLLRYFEEKTGGSRLPRREDLNPIELKDYLPQIGLFEPILNAKGQVSDIYISLLGSRLDDFYGRMTGKKISEHKQVQIAMRIIQSCRQCIELKRPVVVSADALSEEKNFLSIMVLYVPMSSDGETIDRIFLHNRVTSKFPAGNSL
ncbi:MAG: PAS domain-containing protein [Kordiimonadaceae bacterium]|nr:PAS domain-containing protein [Kordiimonadaceae bacterium]MBO6568855.1 PAS domain-containing protein [Kordiimonadaceae bacterium]MBO6965170.1 PAS domain-containing protein [Kordiimonadaceae bacterium]